MHTSYRLLDSGSAEIEMALGIVGVPFRKVRARAHLATQRPALADALARSDANPIERPAMSRPWPKACA